LRPRCAGLERLPGCSSTLTASKLLRPDRQLPENTPGNLRSPRKLRNRNDTVPQDNRKYT
jgi:hypothetical protein